MEAIAKELWTMSDQVGPAESVTNVMPKPKMQRCLVYWVDERLVSIEPVSSVVGNENAKEDAICNIKWKGKGPYRGRIVKISADKDVLKSEQKKLEEQLVNLYSEQPDETEETTPKSISQRGRKRKLKPVLSTDADQSPKKSNASTQPSSSQHDRPKSDSSTVVNKPLKKGKNPISEAKLRLEAKVASQKALFSELIPAPCPFSGLDGVARAIEVVNNPSVDIVNEDMYIQTLETAKDTELSRLKSKVQRLTVLVEERDKEIVTLKTEAKEKTCQKCHGSMFGTKLAITPDNIRFLSELVAELSGNSGYSDSYLPDLPPAEPNTGCRQKHSVILQISHPAFLPPQRSQLPNSPMPGPPRHIPGPAMLNSPVITQCIILGAICQPVPNSPTIAQPVPNSPAIA
ncbi:hypothetical protein BSL78_10774 [Apostichopus japonicus]|uniref:Uncharacterized protein n=1 Tax=Stichopus japonicus TaxID=307972 RepID=A0A2G8KWJ6_STIJA|nr:hypothetical protein BSL78_10774 [Apostichopus japonicus]